MKMAIHTHSNNEMSAFDAHQGGHLRGDFVRVTGDGFVVVRFAQIGEVACEVLQGQLAVNALPIGAGLLVAVSAEGESWVVIGEVGRVRPDAPPSNVVIEATEMLTLRCGSSSMDLRANGQVLIKGEDVTLRAKGTQAIRAGNVSIN